MSKEFITYQTNGQNIKIGSKELFLINSREYHFILKAGEQLTKFYDSFMLDNSVLRMNSAEEENWCKILPAR